MEATILGLHHVTAIADNAQRNYTFYTNVLGLRMVKKTVNFDDPGTYHFYYGNKTGEPGTILTFFPWEGIGKGRNGTGITSEIAYSVPNGSLEFWKERFKQSGIKSGEVIQRFNEQYLPFTDPDGLESTLVIPQSKDDRKPWTGAGIPEDAAITGFHNVTLSLQRLEPTAKVLTDVLGYKLTQEEANRYRFETDVHPTASIIDIVIPERANASYNAAGTIHHIAFRVKDREVQKHIQEKISLLKLQATPQIDRNYFHSVYFREPGGVLFEIATDEPGFLIDENLQTLGTHLMLPPQYEGRRKQIEAALPALNDQ